jgi:hypothetical protein
MKCANCGELVSLYKPFALELAKDHPYLDEFETLGGWWVHFSGPSRYMRSCAIGDSLTESIERYRKFGAAQATPLDV